jgi:redox-regulated HSP33 family molecular chaperone
VAASSRLDGVLDRVLAQHDYPPQIEALVAEAALLTAMIGRPSSCAGSCRSRSAATGPPG